MIYIAIGLWLCLYGPLILSPTFFLPQDNLFVHYPVFEYFGNYLRHFGAIPDWDYSAKVGMWLPPLANNHLVCLPYRWLGYLLVAFGVNAAIAYKISLALGIGLFTYGVHLFLQRVLGTSRFGVTLLLFGGLVASFWHQEQALGTVFFIPFLWVSVLDALRNSKRWPIFFSLLGLSLNNHYPHLILFYLAWVVICGALFLSRPRSLFFPKKSTLFMSAVAFLISAAPVIYSFVEYREKLSSSYRDQTQSLTTATFEEYEKLNRLQFASLKPKNVILLSGLRSNPVERMGVLDEHVLFVSAILLLALALLFWVKVPRLSFQLAIILGLIFLSFGIEGPLPRFLWLVTPGLSYFRQWFHFTAILHLHLWFLIVAVAVGLRKSRPFYEGVAVLGSVVWALSILPKIKESGVEATPPNFSPTSFISRRHDNLANPIGTSMHSLPLQWITKDGAKKPVRDDEVGIRTTERGFEFQLIRGFEDAVGLMWTQYNDGNFRIVHNGIRANVPSTSSFLVLPVMEGPSRWEVYRRSTIWGVLIVVMWVPLLLLRRIAS